MKQFITDHFAFFREFRRQFETTGSIAPSSRFLARALCRPLERRESASSAGSAASPETSAARPVRILEVGPGTGAVTRRIVSLLRPGDVLDLVELNPEFVAVLNRKFSTDFAAAADQSTVYERSLEVHESDAPYDYVVSGLPLNNFPPDLVERIFEAYFRLLAPTGTLSYFEYMFIRPLRRSIGHRRERARMTEVNGVIRPYLDRNRFQRDWVFVNFPPAWVQHLRHE